MTIELDPHMPGGGPDTTPTALAEVVCSECGPVIKQWPCCEAQWKQSCAEMRFIHGDHSPAARQKKTDVKLRLKQSLFSAVSQADYDRLLKLFSWTTIPLSTRGEVRMRPFLMPKAPITPHWQVARVGPADCADPDVSARSQGGNTVLHTAVSTGSEEGVSLLLAIGADVYARNEGVGVAVRTHATTTPLPSAARPPRLTLPADACCAG